MARAQLPCTAPIYTVMGAARGAAHLYIYRCPIYMGQGRGAPSTPLRGVVPAGGHVHVPAAHVYIYPRGIYIGDPGWGSGTPNSGYICYILYRVQPSDLACGLLCYCCTAAAMTVMHSCILVTESPKSAHDLVVTLLTAA